MMFHAKSGENNLKIRRSENLKVGSRNFTRSTLSRKRKLKKKRIEVDVAREERKGFAKSAENSPADHADLHKLIKLKRNQF